MAVLTIPLPEQREMSEQPPHRRGLLHSLLAWREKPAFGWAEGVVLALYCGVLAIVIPFHELWGDEAQAWLIARDSSVWEMIRYRLHYEGAPPLWHLLLHFFHRAGGPYTSIDWFGAVFAAAGIVVLLRWSPFPFLVRALLPFTFFLAYQYAVISRSYVLFPLLVFGLCALYGRREKIVTFAVVAGLLANLSMQGIITASLLACLYIADVALADGWPELLRWRRLKTALGVYAVLTCIAVYTALPAPDVSFIAGNATRTSGFAHQMVEQLVGETPNFFQQRPPLDPWYPPDVEGPEPSFVHSPARWTIWYVNHRQTLNELGDRAPQTFMQARTEDVLSFASQATWPLANSNLLAGGFLLALAAWLYRRRGLRLLVPWVVLIVVGQVLWVTDHHVGMLLILLLAAMWIGFARSGGNNHASSRIEHLMTGLLSVILLLQVGWTIHCARADIHGSYDPGPETAKFLEEHPVGSTAAFHFWSVSVQPFFKTQPFYNQGTQYWLWSWNTDTDPFYRTVVADRPDRIVYSVEFPGDGQMRNQWLQIGAIPTAEQKRTLPWDQLYAYFKLHGYVETHRFCGTRFARLSSSFIACDLVLEPSGADPLEEESNKYADPRDEE